MKRRCGTLKRIVWYFKEGGVVLQLRPGYRSYLPAVIQRVGQMVAELHCTIPELSFGLFGRGWCTVDGDVVLL